MRPALRPLPRWLALGLLAACHHGPSGSDAAQGGSTTPSATGSTATRCPAFSADPCLAASGSPTAGPSASACPCRPGPGAPTEPLLARTLRVGEPALGRFFDQAATLRLQILVTTVPPGGGPWATYGYRVDAEYFYPASAIKTFLAVAALRSMSKRAGGDIPPLTRIERCVDNHPDCDPPEVDEDDEDGADAGAPTEAPSPDGKDADKRKKHKKLRVGEEIQKLLSFSDNDSYNRLFDIVGHRELNEQMAELGYGSVRFHHRMDTPAERSRRTLRVLLLPPGKRAIEIPARTSDFEPAPSPATDLLIGTGYHDGNRLIEEPMSFSRKNYVSLRELQRLNRALLFPEQEAGPPLGLSDKQRALILGAMTAKLGPERRVAEHYPLSPGVLDVLPADRVRYVAKSGRAYGFHLDNAYLEDRVSGRALFVTVTVYANPKGVLNTDDYGYDEISRPLLRALGAALTRTFLLADPPPPEP